MKLFKIIAWIMIGFLILSPIISGILFILMFGLIDINSILLTTGIYSIGFIFFLFNSLILFGFFILGKRTNNKLLSIIPWVTFCLLLIYIIIIISRIISLQFLSIVFIIPLIIFTISLFQIKNQLKSAFYLAIFLVIDVLLMCLFATLSIFISFEVFSSTLTYIILLSLIIYILSPIIYILIIILFFQASKKFEQ